jgi:hypothetical protein
MIYQPCPIANSPHPATPATMAVEAYNNTVACEHDGILTVKTYKSVEKMLGAARYHGNYHVVSITETDCDGVTERVIVMKRA